MEVKEEMRKDIRMFLWFTFIINVPLSLFLSSISNLIVAIVVLFCLMMTRKPNELESKKNE